jgi:hypothetical protein
MNGRDAGTADQMTMECMLTHADLKSPECVLILLKAPVATQANLALRSTFG